MLGTGQSILFQAKLLPAAIFADTATSQVREAAVEGPVSSLCGFDSILQWKPGAHFWSRWSMESSHLAYVAREEGCGRLLQGDSSCWRDSRLQWLQDLLKGVQHWKCFGNLSGYRKRPSLSQIHSWISPYCKDWILLIIGETQDKENVVELFFNHHMPHLKAKLNITSPIWKCLPISRSKLIYSKTNLSICNTLGETLGNLPSILIQQIWLIFFLSSNFRLLIWFFFHSFMRWDKY